MRTHRVYTLAECAEIARMIPQRPRAAIVTAILTLIALVVAAVGWAALTDADVVVRAPARVRARSSPKLAFAATSGDQVTAAIAGRIDGVVIAEGAAVKRGDPIAIIDAEQLHNDRVRLAAAVTSAQQARAAAERMLALAQAQFDAGQAERHAELDEASRSESQSWRRSSADLAVARTALAAATRERDRVAALVGDGADSPMQLDQATEHVHEAEGRVATARVAGVTGRAEVLRRQIVLADKDFDVNREDLVQRVSARTAEQAAAERTLANLDVELAKATVRATHDGVVGSLAIRAGDVVQANQALCSISPADGLRIDAAISAADIALVRTGMRVRLRLDAFDWQRYGTLSGTISQIGTDTEMVATPGGQIPVYVVRVDLDRDVIARGDARGQLKLGMTGTVEVVTERRHLLSLLLGHLHQALSLG